MSRLSLEEAVTRGSRHLSLEWVLQTGKGRSGFGVVGPVRALSGSPGFQSQRQQRRGGCHWLEALGEHL